MCEAFQRAWIPAWADATYRVELSRCKLRKLRESSDGNELDAIAIDRQTKFRTRIRLRLKTGLMAVYQLIVQ